MTFAHSAPSATFLFTFLALRDRVFAFRKMTKEPLRWTGLFLSMKKSISTAKSVRTQTLNYNFSRIP